MGPALAAELDAFPCSGALAVNSCEEPTDDVLNIMKTHWKHC